MGPMTEAAVRRLFPSSEALPLHGLYLRHDLRTRAEPRRPLVYTNFISSLDGHISEADPDSGRRRVPAALANPRDWRLYMELLAQSEIVLTTARHLRAMAAGRQRELLALDDPEYADLAAWRAARALPAQPAVAVLSNRLDFPPDVAERLAGDLLVFTGAAAPKARVEALRGAGVDVQQADHIWQGADLVRILADKGFRSVYSIAGPGVLHTLLSAGALDRIYLTLAPLLLAGEPFDTLTRGPALTPPAGFRLFELYLDPEAPARGGQLLMSFDRAP